MSQPNDYGQAIKNIQQRFPVGFEVPVRNHTADNPLEAGTEWRARGAITNEFYEEMNLAYLLGKSKIHEKGSLEAILEKIFKSWEMEATNKASIKDWKSVDQDNYRVTIGHINKPSSDGCPFANVNQTVSVSGQDAVDLGCMLHPTSSINLMLQKCPAYKFKDVTPKDPHSEESYELLRQGFTNFPWEILDAEKLSDTEVIFTYRHWGYWAGKGTTKKVDMVGNVKAKLHPANGKIQSLVIVDDVNKFFDETFNGKPKGANDVEYPSALAKALGKENVNDLIQFIPKGKSVETI